MSGLFKGSVVLITGATGGFGRAAARRYASEGARLVLSDYSAELLEAAAADIARETGGEIATLAGDVSDENLSRHLVELAIERFGRLDVALNNAGIAQQAFEKLPRVATDEARRIFDIDLLGVFFAMK